MAWTKEQETAIYKDGTNIIVSAGAGSGKTAVLTERVLEKVKNGISVDNLLILTFTKMAAKEMRERIGDKLKKAGLTSELSKLDTADITTFDAYALSLVKKYHYYLNVNKDISIIDASVITLYKRKVLKDIFRKNPYFKEINENSFIPQYSELIINGVVLHKVNWIIFMDKELLKRLLSYGEEREIAVGLTIDDKDYFVNPAEVERIDKIRWGESMRNFQDPWKMLELPVRTLAYIGEADPVSDMEAHFPELKFPLFSSRLGADIIEVQASKANGLVRLCEYYGMDISQTVAFGDSMNDYEIVQAAGTGIAMGNSVQKLKDAADYVTDDIARDGVWKACRHFGWI